MIYNRTSQSLAASAGRVKSTPKAARNPLAALGAIALEPRHLFDGAAGAAFDAFHLQAAEAERVLVEAAGDAAAVPASMAEPSRTEAPARHLLVIDNRVQNWQQLAASAVDGVDVMIIDADSDGLVKIAERMVGDQTYRSLQIVSHGSAGSLSLGNRSLDSAGLAQYQHQLDRIGQALTTDGDILLYGCDVAAGSYGAEFLSALARATRADVAASTDSTGAARLGGDWVLEASTGEIQAPAALSAQAQAGYDGLLVSAALTVVQTSEPGTAPNTLSITNPLAPEVLPAAIGEVVRFRAVVMITEAPSGGATEMRVALPDGLTFINDGSATVGLVSDFGQMSSDTLPGASAIQDGNLDSNFSNFTDVRTLRPDFVVPNSGAGNAVINGTANPGGAAGIAVNGFASGDDIRFVLGNLSNFSTDADTEFVVIEFNVVVANQLSNQDAVGGVATASNLPVSFTLEQGGSTVSVSDSDSVRVSEPSVSGIDKRIVSVVGNTATFEARFTNGGNSALHDVRVFDDFTGVANANFGAVGALPGGAVNNSTATTLDIAIPSVAAGATVVVTYTATITDLSQPLPSTDVVVSGTSLSSAGASLQVRGGEDGSGAPIAGLPTTLTTGERTGADGAGPDATTLNNYADAIGADLSTLRGRLWDDTLSPNNVRDTTPADHDLGGVPITLTWAGPNGVFGDGDDQVTTTNTSTLAGTQGSYSFGGLRPGEYRISAPTTLTDPGSGELRVVFDAGAAPTNDGLITLNIPAANDATDADFAYVRQNAQPTIAIGGPAAVAGNTTTALTGANQVSIADPDLLEGFNPPAPPASYETMLSVGQGTLNLAPTAGVTITGNGSAAVQLTGSVTDINLALASLTYTPNTNYLGPDTLTVTVNDRGNIGDFDGDGIPGETIDDNRQAVQVVALTVADPGTINRPPVANSIDVVVDQRATAGSVESQIPDIPAPSDPDEPAQALTIVVNSLPAANSGSLLLADGTPVQAGQTLTLSQFQSLAFAPNAADTTPVGVDGLIPAGSMIYRVTDSAGASADGAINIRVIPAPAVVPVVPVVPVFAPPPATVPLATAPANQFVFAPSAIAPFATANTDPFDPNSPFDPYQPWAQNRLFEPTAADRTEVDVGKVAPSIVKASNLTNDDCVDVPKPKPKAIKRAPIDRALSDKVKPFSEQVSAARKPFRKTVSPSNPATKC